MYFGEIASSKTQPEIRFSYTCKRIRTFLVTDKQSPNVLGRDTLGKLQLNCKDIPNLFAASEVSSNSDNVSLSTII